MNVSVEVDGEVFWLLAGIAERQHAKVADLLRAAVTELVVGERPGANLFLPNHDKALRLFVAAGWNDREIGEALRFTRTTIRGRRVALGLDTPHPKRKKVSA